MLQATHLVAGTVVGGDYRVVEPLARGGMAQRVRRRATQHRAPPCAEGAPRSAERRRGHACALRAGGPRGRADRERARRGSAGRRYGRRVGAALAGDGTARGRRSRRPPRAPRPARSRARRRDRRAAVSRPGGGSLRGRRAPRPEAGERFSGQGSSSRRRLHGEGAGLRHRQDRRGCEVAHDRRRGHSLFMAPEQTAAGEAIGPPADVCANCAFRH